MNRALIARYAPAAVSLLIGVAAWDYGGRHMSHAFLVTPFDTIVRMVQLVLAGELVRQSLSSLALFVVGFVLALVVGAPAGLLLARLPALRRALDLYIMIIYATPLVALIPFILSLMGFGFAPKVLVVFLFAVFPILYNTVEGARSIKPELIEVARSFRTDEWSLWREVMVPYTLPFTMTGVRQGIGRALVGMIAAEFFLSSTGLGQLIMVASQNFDTGALLAAISVTVALGIALMRLGVAIENRFARWRV